MKFLRRIFGRSQSAQAAASSDFLDVQHARTLQALRLDTVAPVEGRDPGLAIREFYLHNPAVQGRYPLGLLPVGQKRFAKWLLGKGRAQYNFSDAEILGFLQATAGDLPRHIALTYLINPEWQGRFPELKADGRELICWLGSAFPKFRRLREVKALPGIETTRSTALDGVNFLGHFCYSSGLQQAALGYAESLTSTGLSLSCRDVPAGVRTELAPREGWLGLEKFPITISNVSPAPHFEELYSRAGLRRREGIRLIAYWAWELDTIPEDWKRLANSLTEIWAPTPFVAQAMRDAMPVPVIEMLPGVSVGQVERISRAHLGVGGGEFVFLFMFDMCSDFQRKNPLAVVEAFRRAFGASDPATLVIKISRGNYDADSLERLRAAIAGSKVRLVDEVISRAGVFGYIALSDCVVSLHRSEGFGMLMAEAMLLGKPVIATNYSGNTAFMTPENSLLVDYALVPVTDAGPIYQQGKHWAEPSVEHATRSMREVFENRAEACELGRRGQKSAEKLLAPAAAGRRMKARLEEIWRHHRSGG